MFSRTFEVAMPMIFTPSHNVSKFSFVQGQLKFYINFIIIQNRVQQKAFLHKKPKKAARQAIMTCVAGHF